MAKWNVKIPGLEDEIYEADTLVVNDAAKTFDLMNEPGATEGVVVSIGIGPGVRVLREAGFVHPSSV